MKPILYHHGISVCSAKARMTLAEKGVEWEGRYVDIREGESHTPEYLRLNPKGVVPTLVHDGHTICESTVICEYVDDALAGPDLVPTEPAKRAAMRGWTKRFDEGLHFPTTVVLTFAIAGMPGLPAGFARHLPGTAMEPDERPVPNETLHDLLAKSGLSAAVVGASLRSFDRAIGDMQTTLQQSPWLVGDSPSLADIAFAPYLTRLNCLQLDWLWEARPSVSDWFDRIRARPSYEEAVAAWLKPQAAIDAMRSNGLTVREILRGMLAA